MFPQFAYLYPIILSALISRRQTQYIHNALVSNAIDKEMTYMEVFHCPFISQQNFQASYSHIRVCAYHLTLKKWVS